MDTLSTATLFRRENRAPIENLIEFGQKIFRPLERPTFNLAIGKTEEIPEGHGSCLCAGSRRLSEATWLALDIKILRALNFAISARLGHFNFFDWCT
jgi:hypothetical protein